MDVLFLDRVPWQQSQALYHAAAYLNREVLLILRPDSPYVCIGYHQDARQEIDLEFTRQAHIPVFRREVGGGAVYLDGQQLFYQLVIRPDHPQVPARKTDFYEKFLSPVVETYRQIGIPAVFRPVNDITVNARKISGNGAAQIGEMLVLVGNFILDFDYEMMAKVLKVPDEKFRDKVHKTMEENLTTILRETGTAPSTEDLATSLIRHYEPLLGKMEMARLDDELLQKSEEIFERMDGEEWLFANDRRLQKDTKVKIAEGVWVAQNIYKAAGGIIRSSVVNSNGVLASVHFSGDFFFYPAGRLAGLENALQGAPLDRDTLAKRIADFYDEKGIESPGVEPADLVKSIIP